MLCKDFREAIKKLDQFGDQVNFNIKGEEKFKTFPGGLCSILVFLICLAYSGYQLSLLIIFGDSTITAYTDLDYFSQFDVSFEQFQIAFNVFDAATGDTIANLNKFGEFEFVEITWNSVKNVSLFDGGYFNAHNNTIPKDYTSKSLPYHKCNATDFSFFFKESEEF